MSVNNVSHLVKLSYKPLNSQLYKQMLCFFFKVKCSILYGFLFAFDFSGLETESRVDTEGHVLYHVSNHHIYYCFNLFKALYL